MGFDEDLAAERARLSDERKAKSEQAAKLKRQTEVAKAAALVWQKEAADALGAARVPCATVYSRHKVAHYPRPKGRPQALGWVLDLGNNEKLLTPDGALLRTHRLVDNKGKSLTAVCICQNAAGASPVPNLGIAGAWSDPSRSDTMGASPGDATISSTFGGGMGQETSEIGFKWWLTREVARLIEG